MSLSLINIETTFFKGCLDIDSRVDFVTRLSCLAARPSLELWNPSVHYFIYFFFYCPPDRHTITRDGAMGNETFYCNGLTKHVPENFAVQEKFLCPLTFVSLLFNQICPQ